jgi:hypothetical protein
MAIEAINSEVVSFGFSGFCGVTGAVFTIFFVAAKCTLP